MGNPIVENSSSLRDREYYSTQLKDLYIAGISLDDLINKHNFSMKDLNLYLPIDQKINNEFEVHHLGYYLKWISQEAYYYSVENSNFKSRPYRSQGT